jgi:hypothetical protein
MSRSDSVALISAAPGRCPPAPGTSVLRNARIRQPGAAARVSVSALPMMPLASATSAGFRAVMFHSFPVSIAPGRFDELGAARVDPGEAACRRACRAVNVAPLDSMPASDLAAFS